MFVFEFIYNCCFGLKKKTKFQETVDNIETLTDEEFIKLMNFYNRNKCCYFVLFSTALKIKHIRSIT